MFTTRAALLALLPVLAAACGDSTSEPAAQQDAAPFSDGGDAHADEDAMSEHDGSPDATSCDGANTQPCAVAHGAGTQTRTCENGTWSSFGTCVATGCNPGYEPAGDHCTDTDGCAGDACFPGVTCTDVPAPGSGHTCGPCPDGYQGDGETCIATSGNIYYVSPSGKDNNPGTSAAPFASIQHAADVVSPGDTVLVRDGTYTDPDNDDVIVSLTRSGTASAKVTFLAEHSGMAVVDGQNNKTRYCWDFNASYILVEGFQVKGCATGGFFSNSGAQHITVRGNEVHHIGRRCLTADDDGGSGVYQGTGTSDHSYEGNSFHHIGRLHKADGCGYAADFFYDWNHDHGIYIGDGENTVIKNNIFYANDAGWGIQLWGYTLTQNILIANNTFIGATAAGTPDWRVGNIVMGGEVHDAIIDNNVLDEPSGATAFFDYCVPGPVTIRNNITTGTGWFYDGTCGFSMEDNLLGTDPQLVDPAGLDFHLKPGSPASDTGRVHPEVTDDFDGNARPKGAGWDIGAFECQ